RRHTRSYGDWSSDVCSSDLFHVVQQKEINAFALPGGPMFVNIGTINAADNEAELAGVMAHEMAHVYMQHSAKQQGKSSLLEGLRSEERRVGKGCRELREVDQ